MKNKTLLKSLFVLMLIVTFTSQAYASEVIGNLSSSGVASGQNSGNGSEVNGTFGNGTIAGNVNGGGGSGGGASGSTLPGSVLGAQTVASNPSSDNLSFDGTALKPTPRVVAFNTKTSELSTALDENVLGAQTAEAVSPVQANTVSDTSSGMSNWFWIILLLLLIIATIAYLYNRNSKNKIRIA